MTSCGFSLKEKVALITGAGNGIGSATAKLFTKLGANVSLLDINEGRLKLVAAECEQLSDGEIKPLLTVGCVGNSKVLEKYVEDTISRFGKIDVLVNNAGMTKLTHLLESPIEDYDAIFKINVRAVLELTKFATPHLIKSQGSIVNLSSVSGSIVADGRLYYGMSKAAIKVFTEYAAYEMGKHNVRVNCISPGMIKTNFLEQYGMQKCELPQYFEETGKKHALGRCGEPDEIAELIAFLSSDAASFITGSNYKIDGGLCVQPTLLANVESNYKGDRLKTNTKCNF